MPQSENLKAAIRTLKTLDELDERGRIELLINQQDRLNNGDAMAFFGHWLDAVCEVVGIEMEPLDPNHNPFAEG